VFNPGVGLDRSYRSHRVAVLLCMAMEVGRETVPVVVCQSRVEKGVARDLIHPHVVRAVVVRFVLSSWGSCCRRGVRAVVVGKGLLSNLHRCRRIRILVVELRTRLAVVEPVYLSSNPFSCRRTRLAVVEPV